MTTTHFKRNWLWYLVIFTLAVGNIYLFTAKKWSERQARIQLEEEQISCTTKITTITEQNHIEEIKRQAVFYASLLRTDIFEKSWDDAREMMNQIVKETSMTGIQYVLPDRSIELSTDRIMEGEDVTKDLPATLLNEDTTIYVQKTTFGYTLSVPVFENNQYRGRLLFHHSQLTANIAPK